MAKNHTLKFKVSPSQYEQIKNNARACGYVALAPYLRDIALQKVNYLEAKIGEIQAQLKEIRENLP